MLIPSLKTQLLELASPQLLEPSDGFPLVGEQIKTRFPIPGNLNGAVMDSVVDPVRRQPDGAGNLRHRQVTRDVPRMRLPALAQEPMTEPNYPYCAGQHCRVPGRAMPRGAEQRCDRLVLLACSGQLEDLLFQLRGVGQAGQRPHGHRHSSRRRRTPSPDNTDLKGVRRGAMDDDLVDETAQERLLLLRCQQVLPPQFRDLPTGPEEGFPVLGAERLVGRRLLLVVPATLLGVLEFAQRCLPASLQFS